MAGVRPTSPAPTAPGPASRSRASAARTRPWPRSSISTRASVCSGFELTPAQQKLMATWGEWLDTARRRGAAGAGDLGRPTRRHSHARCASCWPISGLSEELVEPPEDGEPEDQDDDDSEQPPAGGDENADGEGEGEEQQQSAAQAERDSGSDDESEAEASASETRRAEREQGMAARTIRREEPRTNRPQFLPPGGDAAGLQGVRDPVRRGGHGRGAVRPQRARPAARPARPVAGPLPGHDRPHGQPAAAQADGAAAALLVVRSRRGHPRHRAPVAGRDQPATSLSFKMEDETDFRDTVVSLLIDNSGLDARPADRGGGDERRHPGPHAGALRGQGRDPGLHHPGLEGRAVARGLAARRQARQSRPAQRPAPHRLQAGRRALAPGAALARADAARGAAQGEHRRRGHPVGASSPAPAAPSSAAS